MPSFEDLLTPEQQRRRQEILAIAEAEGYDPFSLGFMWAHPDLSYELNNISAAPAVNADPLTGIWQGAAALAGPGTGLGNIAQAAGNAARGATAAIRSATSPIRGAANAARASVRPGVAAGEVVTPGGVTASAGRAGQRALPSGQPAAVSGEVIPPPGSAAVPPGAPPRGPVIEGTARPVPPGPQPRPPGAPPAGLPGNIPATAAAAAQNGGNGILNIIRNNPRAAAIAAGTAAVVGGGAAAMNHAAPDPGYTMGDPTEPQLPGLEIGQGMAREQAAEESLARRNRQRDADARLTEAQARKFEADVEKALREMENDDLTESEKMELAHEYAMAQQDAAAKSAMDRTLVTEGGENERNTARIASDDRNTRFRGDVEMRGQDQRAREAQDRFVTDWMQNQIASGRLSLDRATQMYEAYVKQQKLPSEILKSVSDSISPFLPYMTNRSAGESAPGFESGGAMAQLARMAGMKFNPKDYKAQSSFNLMDLAAQYGGGPGQTQPMPTVDQVYQGAGVAPEVTPENAASIRGMSASNTQLNRPQYDGAPDPQSFNDTMPEDAMIRIMGSIR